MGLSRPKGPQSCRSSITASRLNLILLHTCVAYPGHVRVVRCMGGYKPWQGNAGRLLRVKSRKQFCGRNICSTIRWVLGWTDTQNCTRALFQRELNDSIKTSKQNREQTDLQTRNWGLGVGWEYKLFGFLPVSYFHFVKTELSCKNIKHQT